MRWREWLLRCSIRRCRFLGGGHLQLRPERLQMPVRLVPRVQKLKYLSVSMPILPEDNVRQSLQNHVYRRRQRVLPQRWCLRGHDSHQRLSPVQPVQFLQGGRQPLPTWPQPCRSLRQNLRRHSLQRQVAQRGNPDPRGEDQLARGPMRRQRGLQ